MFSSFVLQKLFCSASISKIAAANRPLIFPKRRRFSGHRNTSGTVQILTRKNRGLLFPVLKSCSTTTYTSFDKNELFRIVSKMSTVAQEAKAEFSRLPINVIPSNYNITLKPNLETFTFEGSQNVKLEIRSSTSTIQMNAADLTFGVASWQDENCGLEKIPEIKLDAEKELLTLSFDSPIQPGKGTLKIAFEGTLNDKMKGFYRSKYKTPNGEERYNAVTQFEATDARRCFPCWDEPAIKATFDINVIVPKNKVALSNMPIKDITSYISDDNLHIVSYDQSPIMSTYLVAIVVGEFDYLEALSTDGSVVCRVYTPVGRKEQGRFALDVCAKVLPYYKDYFGIAYPLPKIDLVAIADFAAGAMENWGLVTYRETCLLVDEEQTSATSRQWVALVVGHELAHQWFGNLVTMEWWDGLFLNEGYASFVEFMCVHHIFPDFDIWTQFVTETYIRALELDCLQNSHPVEVPVGHPSEIDEIFDDISYSKGATIIRMLHQYIGDKDFRKGMNCYLNRHQYKNATTEDLWRALGEASSKPVDKVMSTWTKQMGFPILKVTARQEGNNRVLTVAQKKFWADPILREDQSASKNYNWMIPLTFSTAQDPSKIVHEELMSEESTVITIPSVDPDKWVKLNPGTVGYYRVRYTPEMLNQFLPAIKNRSMPPLDRLGLLDDLFAMVQSGESSTVDVLKLLDAFADEDNYTVWSTINNVMGKLNLLMAYTEHHDRFKAYGRQLFDVVSESVGWTAKDSEDHLQTLLRSLVLARLASFGHQQTLDEAKSRFELHVTGEKIIPADLRAPVYRAVLSVGDKEVYETMLKMYRESDMLEEKDRIARTLGACRDPDVLQQVLQFSISEDVRSQDSVFIIISVGMMSTAGRELAWNFFKDNWKLFHDRYPGGQMVGRLVKYVAENFITEEKAVEVREFFRDHPFPGTERTVEQTIESIRLNEAWLKRDQLLCQEFLSVY